MQDKTTNYLYIVVKIVNITEKLTKIFMLKTCSKPCPKKAEEKTINYLLILVQIVNKTVKMS